VQSSIPDCIKFSTTFTFKWNLTKFIVKLLIFGEVSIFCENIKCMGFGHIVWIRNVIKLIKGSQRSDFSWVCTKNFSKILPSCGWCPGPYNLGQEGLNLPHLWCYTWKTWNPKPKKFFFIVNYKTHQVLKGLNSSLAQSTGKLWSCKGLAMGKSYLSKRNSGSSRAVKKVETPVLKRYITIYFSNISLIKN